MPRGFCDYILSDYEVLMGREESHGKGQVD